ncbi:MAG: VWA domain-containing protein [Sulfolobaceae archaeon]
MSYNEEIRGVFRILLVPEKVSLAKGFHYVVLIDNSGSMKGLKIEIAKRSAKELLSRIPKNNKVSLISFSTEVKRLIECQNLSDVKYDLIDTLKADGPTPLYHALIEANEISEMCGLPGFYILLTDGEPTDETSLEAYQKLKLPTNIQIYSFGVGDEYREDILKLLADKSGGIYYHINDPKEIEDKMPKAAVTEVAAKNLEVDILSSSKLKILNYPGPPIKLGAVESTVRILGEVIIPPKFNGNLIKVMIKYYDPVMEDERKLEESVNISYTQDLVTFLSNINKDLIYEYNYYELLIKYAEQVQLQNLVEATKTLKKLEEISEFTRRIDLIETTRRMQSIIETTRRIGLPEQTRRISKEVISEVTRRLRE